jgi:antitoxin (DNA-binding transcriptional repressor) of toxin-antitoxin stability system
MSVTATQLRQDLFRLLDEVLESGQPLEIRRRGRVLRVVPEVPVRKTSRLFARDGVIVGDPEELVSLSSADWDADRAMGL